MPNLGLSHALSSLQDLLPPSEVQIFRRLVEVGVSLPSICRPQNTVKGSSSYEPLTFRLGFVRGSLFLVWGHSALKDSMNGIDVSELQEATVTDDGTLLRLAFAADQQLSIRLPSKGIADAWQGLLKTLAEKERGSLLRMHGGAFSRADGTWGDPIQLLVNQATVSTVTSTSTGVA